MPKDLMELLNALFCIGGMVMVFAIPEFGPLGIMVAIFNGFAWAAAPLRRPRGWWRP